MPDNIFLLDASNQLHEMAESGYLSEDLLQDMLASHPNLLSGSQIQPSNPCRWLLVRRELGIPGAENQGNRWSVDHLFLDQDGVPTLVEVKRSSDTRIRREVVGQILDYAANAVSYWRIDDIVSMYEIDARARNVDPEAHLMAFLEGSMPPESYWELVNNNLRAGKVRMLIVADVIHRELQRVIEFLNVQMNPAEFLGVEIKQFVSANNLKTLVPRVIGQTAGAMDSKQRASGLRPENQWDQASFFDALLANKGEQCVSIAQKIYDYFEPKVIYFWYGKGQKGSLFPIVNNALGHRYCIALWADGTIELLFQYLKNQPPFDQESLRLELLAQFNTIPAVSIPASRVNGRPNFPMEALADPEHMKRFLEILDWFYTKAS